MPPDTCIESADRSSTTRSNGTATERKSRKKRVRLSCMECRKKKLSCDRNLPCQRCVNSGRPSQCSFESVVEKPLVSDPSAQQQEQQIRDLQVEVAELKALISKDRPTCENDSNTSTSDAVDQTETGQPPLLNGKAQAEESRAVINRDVRTSLGIDDSQSGPTISSGNKPQLLDPRKRTPRGYYNQHVLFRFFGAIPELFPFIRDTAEEWFKPLGVDIVKQKINRSGFGTDSQKEIDLERFLPPKEDTDILVSFYLNNLEQIHRVVHIPTFKRDYTNFWIPQRTRNPATIAVILAMISISACATTTDTASTAIKYQAMFPQWISACEEWLKHQSPTHRKFGHYQISCLVFLAKRVSMVDKKRWWKETNSLIQDAIIDGLHCDLPSTTATPYVREMKRRIWAVLRELDLQNSFECGLPTLLHNIDSDVAPPANVDDDDIDETLEEVPAAKPLDKHTCASYQVHSSRSWSLRLEISQRLFSPKFSKSLCYEDTLRYTHEITQAIEAIPSWDLENATDNNGSRLPIISHAYLLFQLKACIIALHHPYLHQNEGRYWLSETICYHTSRDILLLHGRLAEFGIQGLTVFREDLLLASLNLVHIAMLQPKGSTSIIMTDYESVINLLEQCVPFMEDIHLRCCYSELWCFITMYAVIMLLKIHLGIDTRQTAKASCARRYLDLHYRQIEKQKMSLPVRNDVPPSNPISHGDATTGQPVTPNAADLLAPGWLDSSYPNLDMESFDFDINWNSVWDVWEPTNA